MRPTTSTGKAVPGLLAAVVVSIVLGILGMHALSTHGVMSDTDHAAMGGGDISGTTFNPSDGPAVGTILDAVADPLATKGGAGFGEGGGYDMGGMVMLCAAMLAAAAALLLLTLGRRRIPRFWALLAAPTTTTGGVTSRLGTGPPPVWEFSVIRC